MFWKRRNKVEKQAELVNRMSNNENIYTVSFEDLSPGFEGVYIPFFTLTLDNDLQEAVVFARFIDGTKMFSLEEACTEFIDVAKDLQKKHKVIYTRLNDASISEHEKHFLDVLEQNLKNFL